MSTEPFEEESNTKLSKRVQREVASFKNACSRLPACCIPCFSLVLAQPVHACIQDEGRCEYCAANDLTCSPLTTGLTVHVPKIQSALRKMIDRCSSAISLHELTDLENGFAQSWNVLKFNVDSFENREALTKLKAASSTPKRATRSATKDDEVKGPGLLHYQNSNEHNEGEQKYGSSEAEKYGLSEANMARVDHLIAIATAAFEEEIEASEDEISERTPKSHLLSLFEKLRKEKRASNAKTNVKSEKIHKLKETIASLKREKQALREENSSLEQRLHVMDFGESSGGGFQSESSQFTGSSDEDET